MSIDRPSLETLITRIRGDFVSKFTGTKVRRTIIDIVATVFALGLNGVYGFLAEIKKQACPYTATGVFLGLWAQVWGLSRTAATYASGTVTMTGVNGTDIPAGAEMQSPAGELFSVDSLVTIAGGTASAFVTALSPGTAGNVEAAETMTLTEPITGIDSEGTVAGGGLAGGGEEEVDTALRARLLVYIQKPPRGGSIQDYIYWAQEIAAVGRVFAIPGFSGAGNVGVTFLTTDPLFPIPNASKVSEVQTYLQSVAPVGATVVTFQPVADSLDVTISGLLPNTAAVKAAIQLELESLIYNESEPDGPIYLSQINEAISNATGEIDHTTDFPTTNPATAATAIFTTVNITWV